MITNFSNLLASLHGWPVYAVAFAAAFLESAAFVGLAIPGETRHLLGTIAVCALVGLAAIAAGAMVSERVKRRTRDHPEPEHEPEIGPAEMAGASGSRIPARPDGR